MAHIKNVRIRLRPLTVCKHTNVKKSFSAAVYVDSHAAYQPPSMSRTCPDGAVSRPCLLDGASRYEGSHASISHHV